MTNRPDPRWEALSMAVAQLATLNLMPKSLEIDGTTVRATLTAQQAEEVMAHTAAAAHATVGAWYAAGSQANAELVLEHVVLTWYVHPDHARSFPGLVTLPVARQRVDSDSLTRAAARNTGMSRELEDSRG